MKKKKSYSERIIYRLGPRTQSLKCRHIFLLLAFFLVPSLNAQIIISEFLARNDGLLQDEDQESPDWIGLVLSEIMYNPPASGAFSGNDLEFLEFKNTSNSVLDLSSLIFTDGIEFTFPSNSLLEPGAFFVLVRNATAFANKYPGVAIDGVYSGQLNNGGETLTLSHPLGNNIFSVEYNDSFPWPAAPDIFDFSLVQRYPGISQAPDNGSRWRASANAGGSPGEDDPEPTVPDIVINEILSHTDLPQLDSIELYNPTDVGVDISGWYLSDDPAVPTKFRIPNNSTIAANGYMVFDENDFNPTPGIGNSFAISSEGDELHLFSATSGGQITGYSHSAEFEAMFNGVSFGRVVNSDGEEFFPMESALTLDAENAGPRIGPVIINEIHYNPGLSGDEFVELLNTTGNPVPLYSALYPTNTWQIDGIGYVFPQNTSLLPNSTLLVVQTEPDAFRTKYNIPAGIQIFGPFGGQLQDSGENIELLAPDNTNTNGFVPYVVMDAVRYNDSSPWPPAADGSGSSLQRISPLSFGNEPLSWTAAAPTPGELINMGDSDNDGMPDIWEELYEGLKPLVNDADEDLDQDGLTNLEEYKAGTIPNDSNSGLRFSVVSVGGGNVGLEFEAAPNISYSLLYKTSLDDPDWIKAQDISAQPGGGTITLDEQFFPDLETRFYLIVTPSQSE